jgi:hypothetical protein
MGLIKQIQEVRDRGGKTDDFVEELILFNAGT